MASPAPPESDFEPTGTRAPSLWPDSLQGAPFRTSVQPLTNFDPLADDATATSAFDVCHPALALRAVLLVQAVLALVALGTSTGASDWLARQGALAFGGAAATLVWLVLVCRLRRRLGRLQPEVRRAAVGLLGALLALAAWWPLWLAGLADAASGLRAVAVTLTGAALASVLWAWLELRARVVQPASAGARLAELQSRIRPHFLFNALNTAVALVRVDPSRAETVLEDLAELFRVALAEAGTSVSLADEVELARRYLTIEQARFGSRLEVEWVTDAHAGGARVPPLVLQPLVENAVRHGVEPSLAVCHVRIETHARRGQAMVAVHNTVSEEPPVPGNGIALHNVRERLRLLHDMGGQLDTWRDDAGFHARITVPLP